MAQKLQALAAAGAIIIALWVQMRRSRKSRAGP